MSNKRYQNKYRVASSRNPGYDYARDGLYFVTVCTKDRTEYFGRIQNKKMILLELGNIVDKCWCEIPQHFSFVQLREYIVMPNHIHGILEIRHDNVETQYFASPENRKIVESKETQDIASLRRNIYKNQFGPQSNNLSSIIRGFKVGVIKIARQDNIPFAWQERFFDHVIRNEKSLFKIRSYILENPAKWERDRNNPANLLM